MWQTVFYRPKKLGRQSVKNLSKKNLKEKGEGPIWDTIKKEKSVTIVSTNKAFIVTINNETY